jgi:hypothetical protein
VIFGGPALFLVGRGVFEYGVFARVSRNRWIGLLILACLTPMMRYVDRVHTGGACAGRPHIHTDGGRDGSAIAKCLRRSGRQHGSFTTATGEPAWPVHPASS